MLRFRGRSLQVAARLDPPWLGLPPSTVSLSNVGRRWSAIHREVHGQKGASFLSPASGGSPALPTICYAYPSAGDILPSSTILDPPSSGVLLPSLTTCVPLPSPPACPARSRVGTAQLLRPRHAFCPSSTAVIPASDAGLSSPSPLSPSTGAMLRACFPPACPARSRVGTAQLSPSTGSCFPPSPQANPAGSSMGIGNCLRPPYAPWCRSRGPPPHIGIMLPPRHAVTWGAGLRSTTTTSLMLSGGLFSRDFTTSAEDSFEFDPPEPYVPPNSIQSHKLELYSKLDEFPIEEVQPAQIRATVADDIAIVKVQFDLDCLKSLYYEHVKHILVANGIHVDGSLDDTYLCSLDKGLSTVWKEEVSEQSGPLYLSSLDVMRTLVGLKDHKWSHLLDYLRDTKIIVIEKWDLSISTVESMIFTLGWKLPSDNISFYRGQTDASFKNSTKLASLCSIIWNDSNQVTDCLICHNIICKDNIEAELLSMFMLLRRAVDLKLDNLLMFTDCSHCDEVARELKIAKPDAKHPELSMVVVGLKAKFDNVFCQLEPREKLMFPDSLIKLWRKSPKPMSSLFEGLLGIWSPHLLGLPLFRIHQNRKFASAFIGKKHANGDVGNLVLHQAYKVNVKDESRKMDAVRNVVMGMRPKSIRVLVRTEKEAQAVAEELSKLFKRKFVKFEKCAVGEGYVVAAMKGILISARERKLRIIYHSSMEDVITHKMDNILSVKLLTLEDNDDNITALRPECFLFFNGEPSQRLISRTSRNS